MKMRTKVSEPFQCVQQSVVNDIHFKTAEADSLIDVRKRKYKVFERQPDILSVGRNINARKHDFFYVFGHASDFFHDFVKRAASASSANVRDQTITAKIVATVLNFDVRPCPDVFGKARFFVTFRNVFNVDAAFGKQRQ